MAHKRKLLYNEVLQCNKYIQFTVNLALPGWSKLNCPLDALIFSAAFNSL